MLRSLKSFWFLTAAAIVASNLTAAPAPVTHTTTSSAYGHLPLAFEHNEGQVDSSIEFLSRGRGYSLSLSPTEAALQLNGAKNESTTVRWQVAGGNRNARISGESPLPGKTNYFIGNDPAKWRTGVANYANVRYAGVYPGIDLVYHGNQRQVEYDFVVAPKANPKQIRLAFQGVDSMRIGEEGQLILETAHGDLVQPSPFVYQERDGQRRQVQGRYALLGKNEVGFAVGRYDRTRPLVIDPVLLYSTFFGGTGLDQGLGITVDGSGNAYIAGYTDSASFPGSAGSSLQSTGGGYTDAFVTKINAAGTAVVYSTFLGGDGDNEYAMDIAVDGSGNAYITGQTNSSNFPGVSGGSIQPSFAGGVNDAFVTKINAAGSAIVYSTYLGDSDEEIGIALAVDGSGNAYVTGTTASTSFPGVNGSSIQPSHAGGYYDLFATKINAAGSAITWSTFLGGSGEDVVSDILVDGSGNALVTGYTDSTAFAGVNGSSLQPSFGGGVYDAFITKINAAGSAITWSTYLGGSDYDYGAGIALDSSGNVVVSGGTASTSFPGVSGGSLQSSNAGAHDAFITKINGSATSIVWSTFLGGNDYDFLPNGALGLDSSNNVYIGGATYSTTFNGVTGTSMQPSNAGGTTDSYVAKVNAAGTSIGYATFLGGTNDDNILALTTDASGNVYATGITDSTSFPGVTGGSIQSSNGGGTYDAFIVKIGPPGPPSITSVSPSSGRAGDSITFTGTGFDNYQGSGNVWLGSKLAASIVSWSNTQVVATIASGSVTGSAQILQSGTWANFGAFTVLTPVITNVSPTTARAGDSITITGTNFGSTQGSGSVWLGSKLAGSIVSWSNTVVVATVASGSVTGTAQIQQGGVWNSYGAFTVITPNITSITPTTAYSGDSITINGTGFGTTQGSGIVWLGTKNASSIVSWSDTQIVAVIASGSKTGTAQVFQNGVWSNTTALTVITPVVTSISPTSGPVGTQVTINGTGFRSAQGSGNAWIGSKLAGSIVGWSDTQVVATVASGSTTGATQVLQGGVWSNTITFTVTP
jgi:hypothetical protein